jgi:endonuclease G
MPTPAVADSKQREDYLIERPQFVLSYNAKTCCPNWVCWRLSKDDIGKAPRGAFISDEELKNKGLPMVKSEDYDSSGFDRGHMCPAQDRSATKEDIQATFVMTNVVPQAPRCNQHAWERLEDYCRRLTKDGHVLWIAAGPYGSGGVGKDHEGKAHSEEIPTIGKHHKINVPAKLWKVILVLPDETSEPTKRTRVIATIFPNDERVYEKKENKEDWHWADHRVSVAEVEKLTGYKFFRTLPEETAQALKEKVDEVHVPRHKEK